MMPQIMRKILVALVLIGMMAGFVPLNAPASVPAVRPPGALDIRFDHDGLEIDDAEGSTVVVADYYHEQFGVTFHDAVAQNYYGMEDFLHSPPTAIHLCTSAQFLECEGQLEITFTKPQWYVGMFIGFNGSLPASAEVTLTAFNAESGGDVVGEDPEWIGPSDAAYLPMTKLLEVTTDSPVIRRVKIGFPDGSNLAPDLVIDTVTFAGEEQLPAFFPEDCPVDATPPTIDRLAVSEPKRGQRTPYNMFDLSGKVKASPDLFDAILIAKSGTEERGQSILGKVIKPGGEFKAEITNLLFPGPNTVELTVNNCAGSDTAHVAVEYAPIQGRTGFEVLDMEATQAVQDLGNTVP
jgi:hypothetical protein